MSKNYKLSPEKYAEILEDIDLINITLQKSSAALNSEIKVPSELNINLKEETSYKKREDKFIDIFQTYNIDARKTGSKSRFIHLAVTFIVKIKSEKEFTDEFFEIYKDVSLHLNTWPYLREYVNQVTSRMNVPPLTLPLFKTIR